MLVDIHTHTLPIAGAPAIYNIPLAEADAFFSSGVAGWFSAGFHPWFIGDIYSASLFEKLKIWANDNRMVAIGECGLDKNTETSLAEQISVFEKQVALSEEKHKPLIIHCVGRYNELFDLKKQWKPAQSWIIHGFRGKPQLAEQALKAGCSLSYGEHFNEESVQLTPLENLYVETDESHLPVEEIYKRIAEIKKCSANDINTGEKLLRSIIK